MRRTLGRTDLQQDAIWLNEAVHRLQRTTPGAGSRDECVRRSVHPSVVDRGEPARRLVVCMRRTFFMSVRLRSPPKGGWQGPARPMS